MTAVTPSLAADIHGRGVLASRPAAGLVGREYYATDNTTSYRDNGASWDAQSPASTAGLPMGLTGATAATRYVGGTSSGAPASGTFATGDFIIDQTGKAWVCTASGTPGTWAQLSGGGGGGAFLTDLGRTTAGASFENMTQYRWYLKKITVPGAGVIAAIAAHLNSDTGNHVGGLGVAVFTDSAGTPDRVVGYSHVTSADLLLEKTVTTPVARTVYVPVNFPVSAAGDYWIGVMSPMTTGYLTIAYDATGTDRYFTTTGGWSADPGGGLYALTTSANDYSIRASFLAAALANPDDPVYEIFGTPTTAYEFGTSSLTGLTAMGAATAEDANTTVPGHLYLKRAAIGTVALTGRHAAIPGAYPWTAVAKLSDHTQYMADFIRWGGLYIGEASPGKVEAIHIVYNAGLKASLVAYTNPTTFSATIGTDRLDTALRPPIYYGVVATSATSFAWYVSAGGRIWLPHTTGRNPAFTTGVVGVMVDPEQTAFAAAGAYDFLRIWNTAKTFPG